MKKNPGTLASFAALAAALLAAPGCSPPPPAEPANAADSVTTVFEVRGMDCETCEYAIEAELRRLDGVIAVSASQEDSVVVVEIDPRRVQTGAIESRIETLGYDAIHDTRHARDVLRATGSTH